jgi:hypothetical protein
VCRWESIFQIAHASYRFRSSNIRDCRRRRALRAGPQSSLAHSGNRPVACARHVARPFSTRRSASVRAGRRVGDHRQACRCGDSVRWCVESSAWGSEGRSVRGPSLGYDRRARDVDRRRVGCLGDQRVEPSCRNRIWRFAHGHRSHGRAADSSSSRAAAAFEDDTRGRGDPHRSGRRDSGRCRC